MHFASLLRVDKFKAQQFGITTPNNSDEKLFKEGKKYYYWAENAATNRPGKDISGDTDDGSMFYYEVPK